MSEELKDLPQDNKKGFLKTALLIIASLLLLLAVLAGVLQIPSVQTLVVRKLSDYASEKTGFPVNIQRVHLRWFDALSLDNIQVHDQQDSLMIDIEEAFIDFRLMNLLDKNKPSLDEIVLNKPRVQLLKNMPDSGLNINGFIRNLRELLPARKKGPKTYVPFFIDEVVVHEGVFIYHDQHKDSLSDYFDYNHMYLNQINGNLSSFRLIADTLEFEVKELQTLAPRYDFNIESLKTFFRFTEKSMLFDKLALKAGQSSIQDSLAFTYNSQESLEYFVDSVMINANLENTLINSQDLAVFAPYFADFQEEYQLSGRFDGYVRNFKGRKLDLSLGESRFKGDVSMDGLPNFSETFIDAELEDSRLRPGDLKPHFNPLIFERLEKMGLIHFSGQFLGFPNDFVANGDFNTALGKIHSDINLKLNQENQDLSSYSGALHLQQFALGRFLGEPDFHNISMQGKVSGSGLSLDAANLQLNATISRLGYKGYNYRNIKTNGKLARQFFEGKLAIDDPNLQIEGKGSIDLRKNRQEIKISAQLDTAYLHALKLAEDEIFARADININLKGLELDKAQGEINLANAYLVLNNRDLSLDTLSLVTAIDADGRQLMIHTPQADLSASGDFDYTTLSSDLQRLYKEYRLNFRNRSDEIETYYSGKEKRKDYDKYKIEYVLRLKDVNPILQLFEPELYISQNTQVEGSFSGGYTSILSANTNIDTLQYKNDFFYQLEAELNTSKIADSTNVLAMAFLQSGEQSFSGLSPTEGLLLEAIWDRDHIVFSGDIRQQESNNFADLHADVYFLEDKTRLTFNSSLFSLLENEWRISPNNQIIFEEDKVYFKDFKISDENQYLLAEGKIARNTDDTLVLQVANFQLANLNSILEQQLSGSINGKARVQNLLGSPILNGQVGIKDFMVDKFLVGDIGLDTKWDQKEEHLDLQFNAVRKGVEVVSAEGSYNPFQENNSLNIDAIFYQTNLDIIEPFAEDIFSNIKGTASGRVQVTGTPRYPILRGGGNVDDGHIKINYLNTNYTFNGGFIFSENEIGFRNLQLLDSEQNTASLNGGIFHDGFDNFIINLKARLNGAKVLNTTHQDNALYYGTAYAEGDLEVLGPIHNLQFISSARTAKGTKIFIPIDYGSDYVQRDFIHFVSKNDSLAEEIETRHDVNLSGIKLDFDLEITPDAYCEIIFDLRAGDIIRGRGKGKLDLHIDTEGEFTMFGKYEIEQGAYNFTLFNVITKEFIIEPESNIRWTGDPYGGIMDIRARYKQSASLLPILQRGKGLEPSPQERRPYPVIVQMDLEGDLLSPTIDFGIEIEEYPGILYNDVQRFKGLLATDEQFLNRQVFNLIVLRQFAPDQSATNQSALGIGSQTAISSISELLSNQFSALVTQIDENLEIDLDVSSSIHSDAINTFQLRMSYTFLDGRLRVTRDGSIVSRADQRDANNLIGDWTVEYMLTPDGRYRIKVYNRNNLNQLNGVININDYTQGASFYQTKSFDNLNELFKRRKKEKQKRGPIPIQDNNEEGLLREEELAEPITQ